MKQYGLQKAVSVKQSGAEAKGTGGKHRKYCNLGVVCSICYPKRVARRKERNKNNVYTIR